MLIFYMYTWNSQKCKNCFLEGASHILSASPPDRMNKPKKAWVRELSEFINCLGKVNE